MYQRKNWRGPSSEATEVLLREPVRVTFLALASVVTDPVSMCPFRSPVHEPCDELGHCRGRPDGGILPGMQDAPNLAEVTKAFRRGRMRLAAQDGVAAAVIGLAMVALGDDAVQALGSALALVGMSVIATHWGRAPGRVVLPALVLSALPLTLGVIQKFAPMTGDMLAAASAAVGFFMGRTLASVVLSAPGGLLGALTSMAVTALPSYGVLGVIAMVGQAAGMVLGFAFKKFWFNPEGASK